MVNSDPTTPDQIVHANKLTRGGDSLHHKDKNTWLEDLSSESHNDQPNFLEKQGGWRWSLIRRAMIPSYPHDKCPQTQHQNLDECPWLAVLHLNCHTLILEGLQVPDDDGNFIFECSQTMLFFLWLIIICIFLL